MTKATRNTMENTKGGAVSAAGIVTSGSRIAWEIYKCNRDTNKWGKYAKCKCGWHFGFKKV